MKRLKPYKHSVTLAGSLKEGAILHSNGDNQLGYQEFLYVSKIVSGITRYDITIQAQAPGTTNWDYYYLRADKEVRVLTGNKGRELAKIHGQMPSKQFPASYMARPFMGSDPEIFVHNEHKEIIPAWEFLGSKEKPTIGHEQTSGVHPKNRNNIYWDGFQAEFDTMQAECIAWQIDSIQKGLKALLQAARKHNPNAKLSNATVVPVPSRTLREAKEEHVQFGCMPSKNIYGLQGNKESGRNTPYRFAGGHIHFGYRAINDQNEAKIVKSLDAILGVTCVSLFAEYDSPVRRTYYGLAGEYRRPAHGLEYRTLSNAWLMHPLLANMIMNLGRAAFWYAIEDCDGWKAKEDQVVRAIQECDVDLARSILKENKDAFPKLLSTHSLPNVVKKVFQSGIETFIQNPEDIEENWLLGTGWRNHCDYPKKNWNSSANFIQKGEKV